LRTICRQFLKWHQSEFKLQCIGLPVSIKQLENSHFIYSLSQILQEMHFKPEWLVVQIKEMPNTLSLELLEKAFNMLKYLGVKVMIDNFGTGNFPTCHLKNFQYNYIKLDESMTSDIERNKATMMLLKSLILFAKEKQVELIVQGIKTEKQKELFRSLGCYAMQGPFLSEPLTEKEIKGV
jgi:EAL domain-containing protein (putative c-di-GMP-specific phosphodiesterase class I)